MKQKELGEAAQIKGTADALSCSYSVLASADITSPEELIAALF